VPRGPHWPPLPAALRRQRDGPGHDLDGARRGQESQIIAAVARTLVSRFQPAFDAALSAIRADADTQAARKAGDHDRAGRHETLAASYRALREAYQQREHTLAQAMADRQAWEHATASSRHLAIAADTELRRRHPGQTIEPLLSAEPAPASDTERGKPSETATRIRDLAAQHQPPREKPGQRQHRRPSRENLDWAALGDTLPSWWAPHPDAILRPPKPEITPSANILQLAAEHDIEPEAGG
jgi:hypothetical protein